MDEKKIAQFMKSLGLTREEAIALIEEDKRIDKMTIAEINAEYTAEEKQVIKEMTTAGRKVADTPVKRERKADDDKGSLMAILQNALADSTENLIVTNAEREMTFDFNGRKFKLTLSAPRK